MCNVNMFLTMRHHITTKSLLERLNLRPIDYYVLRRRLAWIGKLGRMDYETSVQRRMLTAWHQNPRSGGPRLHFGYTLERTLTSAKFIPTPRQFPNWIAFAKDEALWKKRVKEIEVFNDFSMT